MLLSAYRGLVWSAALKKRSAAGPVLPSNWRASEVAFLTSWATVARAAHCLLIETEAGLVLVDTGLGTRDVADPRSRLSTFFLLLGQPGFS